MSEPLDHGILNLPLAKRMGNIDAQIDRWKAEQARIKKQESTIMFHSASAKKAHVKSLLAALSDERVMVLAAPLGCRKPSTARSALYRASSVNPDAWIRALSKELPFPPGGCATCRAPFGECGHTPDEWLGA